MQESEIVAKRRDLRRFSDQPVAEIVQCGEPILSMSYERNRESAAQTVPNFVPTKLKFGPAAGLSAALCRYCCRSASPGAGRCSPSMTPVGGRFNSATA